MHKTIATLPPRQATHPQAECNLTGLKTIPTAQRIGEAQLAFLNEIEKDGMETVKQLKAVVNTLEAVITAIEKPKRWKFDIDRNFQTNRIQSVTAEVIEE
jgi:hypothetical protein